MPPQKRNTKQVYWQTLLSELVQAVEGLVQSSQRTRKMSSEQLVQTLVLGCIRNGNATLNDWVMMADELGCAISAPSLHDRLTDRVVVLLYGVLQAALKQRLPVPAFPNPQVNRFQRILCYDSTRIVLPACFAELFADTTAGHSSLKVQLGYDFLSGTLQHMGLCSGTDPDQCDAGIMQQAQIGDCLLVDKGYFEQTRLKQWDQAQVSFVIPYQSQTALYDSLTQQRVDLAAQLAQTQATYFSQVYFLGAKTRHPLRIVAQRLSQSHADTLRRHARERAAQAGYQPSESHLILLGWHILVTNLADTLWTVADIMLLYGLRWQVEMVFKAWKSYLEIVPSGTAQRPPRVFAQLLANLIGAVLCQATFAQVRWANDQEVGLFRCFQCLKSRMSTLAEVIRRGWSGISRWWTQTKAYLRRFALAPHRKHDPSTLRRTLRWGQT